MTVHVFKCWYTFHDNAPCPIPTYSTLHSGTKSTCTTYLLHCWLSIFRYHALSGITLFKLHLYSIEEVIVRYDVHLPSCCLILLRSLLLFWLHANLPLCFFVFPHPNMANAVSFVHSNIRMSNDEKPLPNFKCVPSVAQ